LAQPKITVATEQPITEQRIGVVFQKTIFVKMFLFSDQYFFYQIGVSHDKKGVGRHCDFDNVRELLVHALHNGHGIDGQPKHMTDFGQAKGLRDGGSWHNVAFLYDKSH
jgi:hypothetical protein